MAKYRKMSNSHLQHFTVYCTAGAGVLSHLLLFVCLAKDPLKCFRNTASYLVTNLAVADFVMCTLGIMRMAFATKIDTAATVLHLSNTVSLISLFSIFSISLDRYMLTVHPFAHRVLFNGRRVAIWIAAVWLHGCCHLVIQITLSNNVEAIIYNVIFIAVALLSGSVYLITYVSLRRQEGKISQQIRGQNRTLKREFLKTIIIIAFIQIFTLVPPSIGGLVYFFQSTGTPAIIHTILFQMYSMNFAINPFLYVWRLTNYRRTFYMVICRKAR